MALSRWFKIPPSLARPFFATVDNTDSLITTARAFLRAIICGCGFLIAPVGLFRFKTGGADRLITCVAKTGGNAIVDFAYAMVRAGHFKAGIGH